MIQRSLVYHKSVKGTEAIATRQHGLSPKLRSILILIDGKRSFDELAKLSQMLGDTEQLLGQLLDDGFIESGAATAPSPAAAKAPGAAGNQARLAEAKRHVVRRLTDILGPNAEELCLRIEGARKLNEFQAAVARSEGMLRQYVGSQTVEQFMAEVQAHMPAA